MLAFCLLIAFSSDLLASSGDALTDVIQRSAAVKSFTATYHMKLEPVHGGAPAESSEIRLDYVAPDKARFERTSGPRAQSIWCVGGVLALDVRESEAVHARIDLASMVAELAPIEATLREAFPNAAPSPTLGQAAFNMDWSFDEKQKKANYFIQAWFLPEDAASPLGWLSTLQKKAAVPREDGELLRFHTDGAFDVAIAKSNGFLKEFVGKSPNGEMRLTLVSLVLDGAIDPERFALPTSPENSRDVSTRLRRDVARPLDFSLRRRMYQAIASQPAGAPWSGETTAKVERVLRAFHEYAVPHTVAEWLDDAAKKRDGVSERLKQLSSSGKTPAEVEETRQREIGFLTEQLDKLEAGFTAKLAAPSSATALPRADDLLTLEKTIVVGIYRSKVRTPVLEEFEKATSVAVKGG